eukprot:COSAG04_NODE_3714_length_2584_cov_1.424206_3_plen_77_part_00
MAYDSLNLTTPNIHWLGVRPSDMDKYGIPDQCRLAMTESDCKVGRTMMKEDCKHPTNDRCFDASRPSVVPSAVPSS